jgi:hypothetical protein
MVCEVAWETTGTGMTTWELQQCVNRPSGCRFEPVMSFGGSTRTARLADLHPNQTYCWRVQALPLSLSMPMSNIACSP